MKGIVAAFAVLGCFEGASASAQSTAVASCSVRDAAGVRTLCHEIVVPAPRERVWALWSTSDGLSSWAAPLAAIDLRIGGVWEASYRRGARLGEPGNIRNRVLSFLPGRMLSIQIEAAPPGFEYLAEARTLWTVIELESVSEAETRVRVSMTGYREGAAYDTLYRQFEAGDVWTLKKLHERVTIGQTDWRTLTTTPATPADVP